MFNSEARSREVGNHVGHGGVVQQLEMLHVSEHLPNCETPTGIAENGSSVPFAVSSLPTFETSPLVFPLSQALQNILSRIFSEYQTIASECSEHGVTMKSVLKLDEAHQLAIADLQHDIEAVKFADGLCFALKTVLFLRMRNHVDLALESAKRAQVHLVYFFNMVVFGEPEALYVRPCVSGIDRSFLALLLYVFSSIQVSLCDCYLRMNDSSRFTNSFLYFQSVSRLVTAELEDQEAISNNPRSFENLRGDLTTFRLPSANSVLNSHYKSSTFALSLLSCALDAEAMMAVGAYPDALKRLEGTVAAVSGHSVPFRVIARLLRRIIQLSLYFGNVEAAEMYCEVLRDSSQYTGPDEMKVQSEGLLSLGYADAWLCCCGLLKIVSSLYPFSQDSVLEVHSALESLMDKEPSVAPHKQPVMSKSNFDLFDMLVSMSARNIQSLYNIHAKSDMLVAEWQMIALFNIGLIYGLAFQCSNTYPALTLSYYAKLAADVFDHTGQLESEIPFTKLPRLPRKFIVQVAEEAIRPLPQPCDTALINPDAPVRGPLDTVVHPFAYAYSSKKSLDGACDAALAYFFPGRYSFLTFPRPRGVSPEEMKGKVVASPKHLPFYCTVALYQSEKNDHTMLMEYLWQNCMGEWFHGSEPVDLNRRLSFSEDSSQSLDIRDEDHVFATLSLGMSAPAVLSANDTQYVFRTFAHVRTMHE
eukprot:ANDGO_01030.mRNA.1 hypothetical protein